MNSDPPTQKTSVKVQVLKLHNLCHTKTSINTCFSFLPHCFWHDIHSCGRPYRSQSNCTKHLQRNGSHFFRLFVPILYIDSETKDGLQSIPRDSNNKDVVEANEESFVVIFEHGGNDITCKLSIEELGERSLCVLCFLNNFKKVPSLRKQPPHIGWLSICEAAVFTG